MKKIILITIVTLLVMCGVAVSAERVTVTKDTAGTIGHVTAYVTESGQTVFQVDSSGGVTLYVKTLIPISGHSIYVIGESGASYYAIYNSRGSVTGTADLDATKLTGSINNARLPSPIETGVSTIAPSTSGVSIILLSSGATGESIMNISGTSLYGTYLSNYTAVNAGVTVLVSAAEKGMSSAFIINKASSTGGTVYIHFPATQTILCNQTFTAGASKFIFGGPIGSQSIVLVGIDANVWHVQTTGSPTVDTD